MTRARAWLAVALLAALAPGCSRRSSGVGATSGSASAAAASPPPR